MIHWQFTTDASHMEISVPRVAAPVLTLVRTRAHEGQRLLRALHLGPKARRIAGHGVREQGQTMADYAVVLAVVVLAGVAAVTLLSESVVGRLTSFAETIGSLVP